MPRFNPSALYLRATVRQALKRIWDVPLTVVEAPMGYGKTTAVSEYLKDCEATVLWQTLTDDSASGFWRRFCRLLKKIDAGCADRLAELGVPDNSIFMDTALELIADIVFAERTVIVFDDYHLLSSKNIDRFIELLVKTTPPQLHIVIVSRATFGENTPELALKGFCNLIDKSNFEFSQDEITAYYRLCGIRLRPGEAAELYAYTEGWISALYLILLNFVREGRVEKQASLPELIEKAVYRQCPAEVKEFLLAVCVFDSFTLAQAQAIWPRDNAEEIVSYLMDNNAFIKYDQYNRTYQMHNIFTGYLREILERQGAKKWQKVLLAAGGWYLNSGDYVQAMDAFYAAGDFDKLLDAFELDNGRNINVEDKEKVIGYFAECPEGIKRNHPIACLTYARKMFSFNERAIYAEQCIKAGEYIAAVQDEKTQNQLLGEYELIKSFSKYNDIRGMAEHQAKAYKLLDGPSKLFDDNKNFWTYGSPSVLYMFYRKSGVLKQEVKALLEFMPRYRRITSGHGAGAEYAMQAEWHFHRGDFENAGIVVHKAMQAAQSHRQIIIVLCALFLELRLAFVAGDLQAARRALRQMRVEVEEYGQYQVVHTVDMCEGFIYAYLNHKEKIPAWVRDGNLQESRLHFPSHAFFNVIYGKTLLISEQYLKLLGLASHFHSLAGVFPNLLGQVYTYIYTAAAHHKLCRHQEAQAALRQAAAIAAPDGLIMPFVENGEHISVILGDMVKDDSYEGFVGRVNEAYAAFAPKLASMRAAKTGDGVAKLTERETEIAQMAADGLTNKEIGARLYISENTVKMALKSVFEKLGVKSRALLKDSLLT